MFCSSEPVCRNRLSRERFCLKPHITATRVRTKVFCSLKVYHNKIKKSRFFRNLFNSPSPPIFPFLQHLLIAPAYTHPKTPFETCNFGSVICNFYTILSNISATFVNYEHLHATFKTHLHSQQKASVFVHIKQNSGEIFYL